MHHHSFRVRVAALGGTAALLATAAVAFAAVSVTINGQPATISPPPIERAGRVYVPLRSLFERLGASVVYQAGVINATSGNRQISLKVGSNLASVNGVAQALDSPPFIEGATTYVPLRFISQALGGTVTYEAMSNQVAILTPGGTPSPATPVPGAASLAAGARITGSLSSDLSTSKSQVGDTFALTLTPPYPNDDPVFAGAYIAGHVTNVVRAGQGRKPQLGLAFDRVVFADGHTIPIAGDVVAIQQKAGSKLPQQIGGALGGMIVGNMIGKTIFHTSAGGAIGAAGGFLYGNNMNSDLSVPKSSNVTIEVLQPRRQAPATPAP